MERSFTGPLPACDAVTASLSLHHVKDPAVKGDIYRHIFEALRPSGIFVNADTSVPAPALLRERAFRFWAESMRPHGIEEAEARAHFANWAAEDFYTPLSLEFRLLTAAGFTRAGMFLARRRRRRLWWNQGHEFMLPEKIARQEGPPDVRA